MTIHKQKDDGDNARHDYTKKRIN